MNVQMMKQREKLVKQESTASSSFHEEEDEEGKSSGTDSTGTYHPTKGKGENDLANSKKNRIHEMCIFLALTVTSAAVGFLAYYLLYRAEDSEFQSEFQSYARETSDIAENNAESTFGQLRTLATAITSVAVDSADQTFPCLTIPHFDLRAREITELTGVEMIAFLPFVQAEDRQKWIDYSNNNSWWIDQDYDYRGWNRSSLTGSFPQDIYTESWFQGLNDTRRGYTNEDGFMENIMTNRSYDSEGFSVPISQYGPGLVNPQLAKLDLFQHQIFKKEIVASLEYDVPVISEPINLDFLLDNIDLGTSDEMRSFTLDQVKEDFREDSKTVGYLLGVVPWSTFFKNLLPENVNGVVVEIQSDCGTNYTYVVNGGKADVATYGAYHDSNYDGMEIRNRFFWKEHPSGLSRHCHFDLVIYPSKEFEDAHKSNAPWILGVTIGVAIFFAGCAFYAFKLIMAKRQAKLQDQAKRAEAIVASVFPKSIGERLIAEAHDSSHAPGEDVSESTVGLVRQHSSRNRLQTFLSTGSAGAGGRTKPIADLFLDTTVLFADIVGFTAWSSTREPSQVFQLLESVYREFDSLASKRGIYKVETVGDCYVAVAGLPQPRFDHCVAACRFAGDILVKFTSTTASLEAQLGPDTADLGIRIGLHSGSVTAGVLRGERARFQLFGDTVNTTARMESTGAKNRIQISQETANILEESGKGFWFTKREDKVDAKGKGELQTYWLTIKASGNRSENSGPSGTNSGSGGQDSMRRLPRVESFARETYTGSQAKIDRLIDWNVEVLWNLLKQIELRRQLTGIAPDSFQKIARLEQHIAFGKNPSDEVVEIVNLPNFEEWSGSEARDLSMDEVIHDQLKEFVSAIAGMYRNNPFHNFEHASHVTMSVTKLLGRIVVPDINSGDEKDLHDHTYGITSDPLTQFAVVFSAMLHDADHKGVPNTQLVNEGTEEARRYRDQSVAEQNSIDICWTLLMKDKFKGLRQAIYTTTDDLRRFRQLVVNTVLATDIMDKSLKKLRNDRWDRAFSANSVEERTSLKDQTDRKATIVIEHLIQASDVAHTMQHWQVYRKWNANLFLEMYKAYLEGRSEKDPAEFWYKGEIGFFDFYIIPLAKKLSDCGVFGVSSQEYLNYALQNRKEWEAKGKSVVAELKDMADKSFHSFGDKIAL